MKVLDTIYKLLINQLTLIICKIEIAFLHIIIYFNNQTSATKPYKIKCYLIKNKK